ncbi:fungal-specific transcription factor domain-containing protein [Aspergillus granulosus]|uniref:Fungal-specific transcription factor domain-containing protein n=1 Tax=Aspergillus granulosus TaxID=176169 RepID=A0ABR4H7K6_9EURO
MPNRSGTRVSKSIACHRCHARKVKCSGGVPCTACRYADKAGECIYPQKSRLVKVREQFIEDLVSENQRLRRLASHPPNEEPSAKEKSPVPPGAPWFVNADALHPPILVAEASDSAFATRFRQAMSDSQHGHLPRVDFPSDEQLLALSDIECPWPTPTRARLLVRAAADSLGRCYHIIRRSSIFDDLEHSNQDSSQIRLLSKSKLWAVFAIGEMYTTRTSALGKGFPGLHYFCKAMNILRIVSERPNVDMIEIQLLLSVYSLFLNRRHAAYSLAGSAVRQAIIMGLHLNIPESQMSDVGEREHRNRIWWTAYTFDRMWATKLGYPSTIQDEEIQVNLPSNPAGLNDSDSLDFPDSAYFVARIKLARLSKQIIHSIYVQKAHESSLSGRVQDAFADLRRWLSELPPQLQLDSRDEGELDPKARSLHLLFNQLAILATRPILLRVLRAHLEAYEQQPSTTPTIPASAITLSETCIRCARHSCSLLVDSWTNNTFMVFDFFYTQYLFSAATIMGISSLLDSKERRSDEEQFEIVTSFLLQLRDNGNYAAAEFYQHIEAATNLMQTTKARLRFNARNTNAPPQDSINTLSINTNDLDRRSPALCDFMTAGMALSEPLLQELLEQPLSDLEFIDSSMYLDEQQVFYWPTLGTESGAVF